MKGESGELVLGRYRIEHPMGHGGFGRIHVGRQVSLHREVAIKSVRPELAGAAAMRERFRREAVVAASINHPNVVTYHDFGVDEDGDLILVMERLKGWTLLEDLRKRPRPPALETARRIRQAAAGLGAAHEAGIVHRDVKPSNLFLVAPGRDDERVKVIDFGILRVTAEAGETLGDLEDLTCSDAFIGTPEFAAPEMILGLDVDGRADQYALALVAYLMLTGRKGFVGRDPGALLARVSRRPDAVESAAGETTDLAGPVRDVLYRALTPDPEGRFPTVGAFADALEAAVSAGDGSGNWDCPPTALLDVTTTPGESISPGRVFPETFVAERPVAIGRRGESKTERSARRRRTLTGATIAGGLAAALAGGILASLHLAPPVLRGTGAPDSRRIEAAVVGNEREGALDSPSAKDPVMVSVTSPEPGRPGGDGTSEGPAGTVPEDDVPQPVSDENATGDGSVVEADADIEVATKDASPLERPSSRPARASRPRRMASMPNPKDRSAAPVRAPREDATLTFNAEPWAEVRLDGRLLGTTPVVGVKVAPGAHRVEFRHPELGILREVPDVAPGESRTVKVRFREVGGRVSPGASGGS